MIKKILILLIVWMCFGCKKPDFNSYQKDYIYKDLEVRLKTTSDAIVAEKKQLEEMYLEKQKLSPQSPMLSRSDKRIFQSQKNLSLLEQQKKYLVVALANRKTIALNQYLAAFNANKPWPDEQEFKEYQLSLELQNKQRIWSPSQRLELYQKSRNKK